MDAIDFFIHANKDLFCIRQRMDACVFSINLLIIDFFINAEGLVLHSLPKDGGMRLLYQSTHFAMVWNCDCGFRTRGRLEDILAHVRGHHDIDIRTGLSHFAHCNEFNCCRFNGHGRRINWKETRDCDEIVITPTINPILCTLVVNSEDGLIKHLDLEDSHGISLRKAEP